MVLDSEKIQSIIKAAPIKKIVEARKIADKNAMHVTGVGSADFLQKLDDYENESQLQLRRKLLKSNRALFSFLWRPADKIFTAKGGAIDYNLPDPNKKFEFEGFIKDTLGGITIENYLKNYVKKEYIIDPNAILFCDFKGETPVIELIPVSSLHWFEAKGKEVEAFISILEKDEEGRRRYRVVDELTDKIFVEAKDANSGAVSFVEDVEQTTKSPFSNGKPVIIGDQFNSRLGIYESFMQDIIEDADEFLRDTSIKTVHKLAHGFPVYWSYNRDCVRCEGEGVIKETKLIEGVETVVDTTCPSCGGDGLLKRKNVSDHIMLRVPNGDEPKIAPDVAGVVQPSIAWMDLVERNEEQARNKMFQAVWGTVFKTTGKRETATGRFIDEQPIQDRLKEVSDTFQKLHEYILNCLGKVFTNNLKYRSSVIYGTRYLLESPDEILKLIIDVTDRDVSSTIYSDLIKRYFDTEYSNDTLEAFKKKKLLEIEPFPNIKLADLTKFELPNVEKLKKLYFIEWSNTLSDSDLVLKSKDELRTSLLDYVNTKIN